MQRMNNLQFLIGVFLVLIGAIVLGVHFFGADDVVQGVQVNLLGGAVIAVVGVGMILGGLIPEKQD
jgi:hypothetical protein